MSETINAYSVFCRLFGNLFYRSPKDETIQPVLEWLSQGNLVTLWGDENDDTLKSHLKTLSQLPTQELLSNAYEELFVEPATVATQISAYSNNLDEFLNFREKSGLPAISIEQGDHVAHLLLCMSWLEDQGSDEALRKTLLTEFMLPTLNPFLGQVEAHATLPFYRSLSRICREIIDDSTIEDSELQETDETQE